jgi:hypothetical protein
VILTLGPITTLRFLFSGSWEPFASLLSLLSSFSMSFSPF